MDDLPRPAQPKTEPARPRTPTLRPPAQDLDELAQFARNGRLTDVEDWIRRFANVPGYASFLDEVQKCVDALEFAAIEALLGSAQDQADLTSVDLDRILPHRV